MTFPNDYETIRNQVIHSAKVCLGQLRLNECISDYGDVINSNRFSSCIKSFEDLLSALEKRGHVGAHSISGLRTLSDKLSDIEVDRQMSLYEEHLENHPTPRTYENQYALPQSRTPTVFGAGNANSSSSSAASMGSEFNHSLFSHRRLSEERKEFQIPEIVIALICEEIGKQWMELARKLGVREGEIDSINDKYSTNLKAKAREVLKLFMQRTDPVKWQCKLLDGLVQARRRDLKESVEEVLTRRRY